MPMGFYTIEQTKDCINHTEQQLRELISTILSRKYGPDWEHSSSVWDETTRKSLEMRRQEDQGHHPYQIVSQKLLDYSNILNLRTMIEKHWDLFSGVFQSKERIMRRFDDLQSLRNPEMHGRPDILPFQKHLCLGVCGEILAAIDYWSSGYEHTVREYTLGLRIPAYMKNGDEIAAQEEASALAHQWLEKVCSKLGVRPRELPVEEGIKGWQIAFQHMHVRVTIPLIYPGNDGRFFKAADITIKTVNATALSRVIEAGEHPYWLLCWTLKDDLGPSTVADQVFIRTGKRPVSSTVIRAGDVNLLTHAEFRVGETDGESIRITLSRWKPDEEAKICLIYEGATNQGFYCAHEIFSIKDVLSILYGEISHWKVKKLVEQACSPKDQI